MKIETNKLKILLNRKKIENDFTIYKIEKEKGFFKPDLFFIDKEINNKIISNTIKQSPYRWYLLVKSKKDEFNTLKNYFEKIDSSINFYHITINQINDVDLTQLLVNTLDNPKDKKHNILKGRLFYSLSSSDKNKIFAQVKITDDGHLKILVKSFTNIEYLNEKEISKRILYTFKDGFFC